MAVVVAVGITLRSGISAATIEEQRHRLPPPAACDDPVAGVWRAHVYYEHVSQWYTFRLEIHRASGGSEQLEGTIEAEFWNGDENRQGSPPCRPGGREAVVENARGSVGDMNLHFEGVDWRVHPLCDFTGGYLLDSFSGRIDAERHEFQSVLNADAPQWRDVPTVFRRVECFEAGGRSEGGANEPRIVVAPPPFLPPADRSDPGCSCIAPSI